MKVKGIVIYWREGIRTNARKGRTKGIQGPPDRRTVEDNRGPLVRGLQGPARGLQGIRRVADRRSQQDPRGPLILGPQGPERVGLHRKNVRRLNI